MSPSSPLILPVTSLKIDSPSQSVDRLRLPLTRPARNQHANSNSKHEPRQMHSATTTTTTTAATMTSTVSTVEAQAERRKKYHEADVVVVGAGVFGCAIAYALARRGRSVLLLERWMSQPDRIVGELLQPGGVEALRRLGLAHCLDDIDAVPCYGYNVLYYDQNVIIPYPAVDASTNKVVITAATKKTSNGHYTKLENDGKSARPEGRAFHHGRFIMNLRRACLAEPNITVVETEVTGAIQGETSQQVLGVEALTKDAQTGRKQPDYFFGALTIAADGYDSRFRKRFAPTARPIVRSKFYALELLDCELPAAGYGTVVIGRAPSPVLLYQIGTRETRALIDVPIGLVEAAPAAGGVRGYIRNSVAPNLPPAVSAAVCVALDRDPAIPRSMPNSWLPARRTTHHPCQGLMLAGDALNMRHPLTGGGMTVALSDAAALAELLAPCWASPLSEKHLLASSSSSSSSSSSAKRDGLNHQQVNNMLATRRLMSHEFGLDDAAAIRRQVSRFCWERKALASVVNVLAQALYSLFAARDDVQLQALQRGCFAYFQRGVTDAPMGLLGGLIHEPVELARHFFSVAFLAIWLDAKQVVGSKGAWWGWGLLMLPVVVVRAVLILWKACVVFLPVCFQELL